MRRRAPDGREKVSGVGGSDRLLDGRLRALLATAKPARERGRSLGSCDEGAR